MAAEPPVKRAIAFVDGQNLYHAARTAFGYTYPNFNPARLAQEICRQYGWHLVHARFYTGVPDPADNFFWNQFWQRKLAAVARSGTRVITRPIRYRMKTVVLPDGGRHRLRVGEEKGIDVRIALDVVFLAHRNEYDVALIFSQDQDLAEAIADVREIARDHRRWIKVASAFPLGANTRNRRGIDRTDWIPIARDQYDRCVDRRDFRPPARTAA